MSAYLIVGASGFIGRHIYNYCKENQMEAIGTYYNHCDNNSWIKFDMCSDDLEEICCNCFKGNLPDYLILCGANAGIDSCKRDEQASHRLNVIGTQRVLRQADQLGIKSVFLSSEAVFDGSKGINKEEDTPNPVTLYGRQKLEVERYIADNITNCLIFRISRAVGSSYGEKDIFQEFYDKIIGREEIVCLRDQSFCLTEVNDIVLYIVKSLERELRGLFHISSNNYISRFELARLYAEKIFGGYDKIVEKEYTEIPFLDSRHIFGGLDGRKLASLIGIKYVSTSDILNRYLETRRALDRKP